MRSIYVSLDAYDRYVEIAEAHKREQFTNMTWQTRGDDPAPYGHYLAVEFCGSPLVIVAEAEGVCVIGEGALEDQLREILGDGNDGK